MKTTFTINAIRAALVLLLSSTATPRGFQENGATGNRQGSHGGAPTRSSGPNRTAQVSRQMPASPRSTPSSQGVRTNPGMSASNTNRNVNTNINRNTNINTNVNRNENSNAWNRPAGGNGQGYANQGARGTNQGAGTQTGRGTNQPPTQLASNANKNVNINKNINVNQNTNSNGWNRGSGRPGSGFSGGRGTDVRGPQGSAFTGNSNFNSNTNVNINRNTNVNVNRNSGGDVWNRGRERHIDDGQFRSHFGRDHQFHVNQGDFAGGRPWFQFSGVSFQAVDAWPASWRYSDPVYVDSIGGSYVLCNPMHPGIFVPMNISDCASCAPQMIASNANCVDCGAVNAPADPNSVPTLTRGQTMDQVVAMLGTPRDIVDLGARQIYLYNDMRVTFVGGHVSDVR